MKHPLFTFVAAILVSIGTSAAGHAAVLVDEFNTAHDYSGGSVAGTIWSGVLNAGNASTFNATTTTAGELRMAVEGGTNTGWDSSHSNAPFLYLNVSGDFSASVRYTSITNNAYSSGGLMLHADSNDFISTNYFGPNSWNSYRQVINGAQSDNNTGNGPWLRLDRVGNTYTSYFSEDGVGWNSIGTHTALSGDLTAATLKVGLHFGNYGASPSSSIGFDNFSITVVPEPVGGVLLALGLLPLALRRKRKHL